VPIITGSERRPASDGGGGEDNVHRGFSVPLMSMRRPRRPQPPGYSDNETK
jgi:hypothetical protein